MFGLVSDGGVHSHNSHIYGCLLYTSSYGYNEDEIVSSDIGGMRYGSLFDATQTRALPLDNGTTEVQVVSWYDNENSYTSQMVCLLYTSRCV